MDGSSWWQVTFIILVSCSKILYCQDESARAFLPFCRSKGDDGTIGKTGANRSLYIVSTLDGRISAIDAKDGQVAWSVPTGLGSMLSSSSSLGNLELTNNGNLIRLYPTLNGGLYRFDGTDFVHFPYTTESLLSNSVKVADNVVVSGYSENRVFGVEFADGKIRYMCNGDGCTNYGPIKDDDVLVVTRRQHVVRAVDPRTGVEKWNYSVGQHEMTFIESSTFTCSSDSQDDNDSDSAFLENLDIRVAMFEGRLIAVRKDRPDLILWQQEFDSPVTDAWIFHHKNLQKMNLFSTSTFPYSPNEGSNFPLLASMYLGSHDNQHYIMQSDDLVNKVKNAGKNPFQDYPFITWKPYLVTAVSRTPTVIGSKQITTPQLTYNAKSGIQSTALMIRHDSEYPYDGGFYIFSEETPIDMPPIPNKTDLPEYETQTIIVVYEWKELIFGLVSVAIFTLLVHCYIWSKRGKIETKNNNNNVDANLNQIKALASIVQLGIGPVIRSIESDIKEPEKVKNTEEFVSRYLTDFEPIQCLGRGGFGVVFHARNKIDDCDYAIKRICLPNKEDAREKVMREVKALAKLDHVGIVRYYNAWLESPPIGWQENMDKHWEEKGLLPAQSNCVTAETSLGAEKNGFINIEKIFKKKRQNITTDDDDEDDDYGGSNIFQITENNLQRVPFQNYKSTSDDSDSFIVFETSDCNEKDSGTTSLNVKVQDSASTGFIRNKSSQERPRRPDSLMTTTSDIFSNSMKRKKKKSEQCGPRIYLHIQTQLCKKENLKDWLNANLEGRDKLQMLDFFDQIVSAVDYVHGQGLIHRDLKPSNIFFSMDGAIKVGDFGLVATMGDSEDQHTPIGSEPVRNYTDRVGTQLYMSPEQIAGLVYSHKVDIFSLGLIFFELLIPFFTQMERIKVLTDLKRHKFPNNFLEEQQEECEFVKHMLSHDPDVRPNACDIRQHSLLQVFQPGPEILLRHRHSRTGSRSQSFSSSEDFEQKSFSNISASY